MKIKTLKNKNDLSFKSNNKIWIYGYHPVISALQNERRKIMRVFTYDKYYEEILNIISKRKDSNSNNIVEIVDKSHIQKFLPEEAIHQGLAILCTPLESEDLRVMLSGLDDNKDYCILILDQVTDTRNIGSIIRSAVAFNVDALIFTRNNFPKENGLMVKSSAGGMEKIKFIEVANLSNAINLLKETGFWIVGLDAHTSTFLHQLDYFPKTALVLGSENKGMRELTKKSCDFIAKIPINSQNMESLNISNATAIALYEIYKNKISSI